MDIRIYQDEGRVLAGLPSNVFESASKELYVARVVSDAEEAVYWRTGILPHIDFIWAEWDDVVLMTDGEVESAIVQDIVGNVAEEVYVEGDWICVDDPWVGMTGAH